MNKDVEISRERVSRRRALALGGTIGLGGLISACSTSGDNSSATTNAASQTSAAHSGDSSIAAVTNAELLSLLDQAPQCSMSKETTQGPYWFDVDSIRSDIREDRPGLALNLALRVQDINICSTDGKPAGISNAVVEIWHCDAGGTYSGFESGSLQANSGGQGTPPAGSVPPQNQGSSTSGGETSNGSYSVGDREATATDDSTYLRGAQTTNSAGIAEFTTIYPGWYRGRTVHIHVKVHIDKKTVVTTQLFFHDSINDTIFAEVYPYNEHTRRDTTNANDNIYDSSGLVEVSRQSDKVLAAINLGIDR
ncbi:MAG: protocatechuate dioxygenase [Mycobacteriaceae bacterium]